ncbi:tryptophan halogenase family protein [Gimibacter soli]|uniref:Tryptophan 7-halogenase n=1 Tax=Gimibacter soli TaxID=3024400 RepID=A0AAF0BJT2_9PROT|nr:tryptophan halogenase family protein [Gimibacter soli]WCL53474.1 tryptophan 7-halogenase [Gimibacter soli]
MTSCVRKIVIVGGGSAGWITAGLLAAKYPPMHAGGLKIIVIEAPDIPIVGVGEGTWPSMRSTLRAMQIDEWDFVRACSVSFKQGSKFCQWRRDDPTDFYYHPFEMPLGFREGNVAESWYENSSGASFSRAVSSQEALCEAFRAPKLLTSPGYAGFSNYGYHLDASAFAGYLRNHCISKLGVKHISDTVIGLAVQDNQDIASVETQRHGVIEGDLFVDCTGFKALLLGGHFEVDLMSVKHILFPDKALAVQVPYREEVPVQSTTISTAQPAGWIWDVSLSSRRGIGHVFSSDYMSEEEAVESIRKYIDWDETHFGELSVRQLSIGSGYRRTFWKQNCVAVGLSAGFLEPLEASALMLIERSANMIADNMPASRHAMEIVARRFNERMHSLWESIVQFLKLHYCLSQRNEPFWKDNRAPDSLPLALSESLRLWKEQAPRTADFEGRDDVFPIASYQYVLYGMGFEVKPNLRGVPASLRAFSEQQFELVRRRTEQLLNMLPENRQLLDYLKADQRE